MTLVSRRLGLQTVSVPLIALGAGALVVQSATLAGIAVLGAAGLVALAKLRERSTWTPFLVALGGSMILGYGFINIAIVQRPPVPLVDVLLVGVFVTFVLRGTTWPKPRLPFILIGILFVWATLRLFVDAPRWGSNAFRDYTTYVEMSALFVGYWAMQCVGLDRWLRALTWIFGAVVVYGLLTLDSTIFGKFNVTVGLLQPVPLFGQVTGVPSVSAFFFFILLRRPSFTTAAFAAAAIPPLLTLQSRGLYIALPLALAVVIVARAFQRSSGGMRFGKAAAVTALVSLLVLSFHPVGRFGEASASLVKEQLLTLVGHRGVGSGSLTTRTQWFTEVNKRISAHKGAVGYGLGLGPDLTNGFVGEKSGRAVRKPHDDYLEMYARLGLPALLTFLFAIGAALTCITAARRTEQDATAREFLVWCIANSVVYLFIAATQPFLAYPFGTIPLFAIMGAGLAVARGQLPTVAPSASEEELFEITGPRAAPDSTAGRRCALERHERPL